MTLFQTDEIIDTRVAEVVVQMKFPRDAPKPRVMKAFEALGFHVVRTGNHSAMVRENPKWHKNSHDHAKSRPSQRFYVTKRYVPRPVFPGTIFWMHSTINNLVGWRTRGGRQS